MTIQEPDYLIYAGERYEVLGDTPQALPCLNLWGIEPTAMNTGCYRGYIAAYTVDDNQLYLTFLQVYDSRAQYPEIGQCQPVIEQGIYARYPALKVLLPFTGYVVIGMNLAYERYFPEVRLPHDYRQVLGLTIEMGVLKTVEDLSRQAVLIQIKLDMLRLERQKHADFHNNQEALRSLRDEEDRLYAQSKALLSPSSAT